MEDRDLAVALATGRIAIGLLSLLTPGIVGRAMIGARGSTGGTRLLLRMVGARDLALGLGVIAAMERDGPVRGWLEASALVDGLDLSACVLARHHLRPGVAPVAAGMAGGGTLMSAWLASRLDDSG
jgi:hypothetical protein